MNNNLYQTLDQFEKLSFIVIGDAMLDIYIMGSSQRLCREAPVPIVSVESTEEFAGGAANTAVNVSQLGASCYFISTLGSDADGDHLLKILAKHHIDTSTIVRENRKTLSKERVFSQNQQLVRFDYGKFQKINKKTEDIIIKSLSQLYAVCDGIIISDYEYGLITQNIAEKIRDLQKQYKKILVIDAKQPEKYEALAPTLVKPNFQETIRMLKIANPPSTNRISFIDTYKKELLEKTGSQLVAVTLDNEGSIIFQRNSDAYQTSTIPVDNTKAAGAGDTYTAMFSLALAANLPIQEAADLAALAAEIVVHKDLTANCTVSDVYLHDLSYKKQLPELYIANVIRNLKQQKKQIVFTNGCFDILHSGHITYLNQAKKLGDILIVGLNTDESVKRLKGEERPINSLPDRMQVLSGLASVDYVIPFGEDTPISLIKKICPDIYVKGGDYTRETLPEVPIVESMGGRVEIIPYVKDHSTTQIIESIRKNKNRHIKYYSYE